MSELYASVHRVLHFLLCLFIVVAPSATIVSQIDIIIARQQNVGQTVTVQGIVTNGDELGPIRYMQDATAGIAVYSPGNFSNTVQPGDEVLVTGVLKDYNNLLEIDPVSSFEVISSGNPIPTPEVVTPNQLTDAHEAELLRVNGATFTDAGGTFGVDKYEFTANGESGYIYLRANHPLVGTSIPLATVNVTGILSQFQSDYELLPRSADDIEIADAFFIITAPVQSDITQEGFTLKWATNAPGTTRVTYGTTPDMVNEIDLGGSSSNHEVVFTDLEPGNFYYVKAFSSNGSTIAGSNTGYYSTASNSTGEIIVYFNHEVDASFSNGSSPAGTSGLAIESAIIDKIDAATQTIDVAMYNINRRPLIDALDAAKARGVRVRYVTNIGSFNEALTNPAPAFPVLPGNGEALMHNKFFIIDKDLTNQSWLIMGSMNATIENTSGDYNNMLFIQDQALAKSYTVEFEEMWGGSGPNPGIFSARFGANKKNNTPHLFLVNGMTVENYFSPSDNTTFAIVSTLESADTDLEFALLSFTRDDLGAVIASEHDAGVDVRGMIESINDQGSEFTFLMNSGVDVRDHTPSGSLHHKYAIVDATNPGSSPRVVTGSHNWSTAAETSNDENTLIFHDADIANLFLQEFEQRWCEVTSPGNCFTPVFEVSKSGNIGISVAPNPVTSKAFITIQTGQEDKLTIRVIDANGKLLSARIFNLVNGSTVHEIDLGNYPAGTYYIQASAGTDSTTATVVVK